MKRSGILIFLYVVWSGYKVRTPSFRPYHPCANFGRETKNKKAHFSVLVLFLVLCILAQNEPSQTL